MPPKSPQIHPASPTAKIAEPVMDDMDALKAKLKSIDDKLKQDIIPQELAEVVNQSWFLLKEYLSKSTSQSIVSATSTLSNSAKKKIRPLADYAPLVEMAKLPVKVRLELTELIEKLMVDLEKFVADDVKKTPDINLQQQNVKHLTDTFLNDLAQFIDKNKKITAIGTITTAIASFAGLVIGAVLAPFSLLILPAVAAHYVGKSQNSTAKALGAGILGFLASVILLPVFPLIIGALPIIKNTALSNFQLGKIDHLLKQLKEPLTDNIGKLLVKNNNLKTAKPQAKAIPRPRSILKK